MKGSINELKETMTELVDVLMTEIHEINQILLETQAHLLAQQQLTKQAYKEIAELQKQIDY